MSSGFDTPEGAILMLENAYKNQDFEQALKCKDFDYEAEMMLKKFKKFQNDRVLIAKTSALLKLAFTKEIREKGYPDFNNISCEFIRRENKGADFVIVTEQCKFRDGRYSRQRIPTVKTKDGWKVLAPLD